MSDSKARIDEMVKGHNVMLFMKGTPDFPQCGFSMRAVTILNHLGAEFSAFNVLEDPEVRQGIKDYASWPTIPQLYVGGEFLGGSDIMVEMFENGELATAIAESAAS